MDQDVDSSQIPACLLSRLKRTARGRQVRGDVVRVRDRPIGQRARDGRDAPVYTTSQPGFGEVLNTTSGAARILWQQAFARSVRGLLADPGFRTFVAGGSR